MAQNVTVAGASYSDVPAVELPKTGGGTATFYDADFKTVSQTLTNITSSVDETRVENGNSFYCELTPTSGYVISSITVTMGGVDITDQVFKAGTGAKTITANGTYAASADGLSGYTAVSVNVSGGSASLGTKSITTNGTYNASSDNLDGYSQVTVNVPNTYSASDEGKVVSSGALVSQTSTTYVTNGTYDTTTINSVTVNVSAGVGYTRYKTGTITPSADYKTGTNVELVSIATLGFTPSKFTIAPTDLSDISGKQYAIIGSTYEAVGNPVHYRRSYTRYQNTSNSLGQAGNLNSWTTRNDGCLYLSNNVIYFRASSNTILFKDVEYTWYAYE